MPDVFNVIMRLLHICSMAILLGGILYARIVLAPSSADMAPDSREALLDRAGAAFRPWVIASTIGLLLSGVYNLLVTPGHRPIYHMLLGIKILLALHVFAVAILITQPKNPRRNRMMTGALVSGFVILGLAAYLRRIF